MKKQKKKNPLNFRMKESNNDHLFPPLKKTKKTIYIYIYFLKSKSDWQPWVQSCPRH